MSTRYVQMAVPQEDFDVIRRQAFEEKLTLSELLEKAVKLYILKGKEESVKVKSKKK